MHKNMPTSYYITTQRIIPVYNTLNHKYKCYIGIFTINVVFASNYVQTIENWKKSRAIQAIFFSIKQIPYIG